MRWCLCCLFSKNDVYDPYEEFDLSYREFDSSYREFDSSSSQDSDSSSQASTVNTLHTILLLDNY